MHTNYNFNLDWINRNFQLQIDNKSWKKHIVATTMITILGVCVWLICKIAVTMQSSKISPSSTWSVTLELYKKIGRGILNLAANLFRHLNRPDNVIVELPDKSGGATNLSSSQYFADLLVHVLDLSEINTNGRVGIGQAHRWYEWIKNDKVIEIYLLTR